MRVLYVGNFEPPHSTENHIRRALEHNGHVVTTLQENMDRMWPNLVGGKFGGPGSWDLLLWTRTGWDYPRHGYKSQEEALMYQLLTLQRARAWNLPTVGYHLDIWHGLAREYQLEEPFFHCDVVVTADGGHEEDFKRRGINHVWFPPAVSEGECKIGTPRDEFTSKLAFVGSWQGGYHPEHQHREELVQWLQKNYRRECAFWPQPGMHAVRGKDLQDLYASVDVVVGDSCFAGKISNYWSDRIPETLGRGGFLLHPCVEGLDEQFPTALPLTWRAGDWDALGDAVDLSLTMSPAGRTARISEARHHVLEHHTYERRMVQLLDLLRSKNLLDTAA